MVQTFLHPGPSVHSRSDDAVSVSAPSAPGQVSGLRVSNLGATDSLQAEWFRASGDLDSYRVLLVHDSSVIKNESVGANTTGLSFQALRPGALYKVVLTTVRAGHSSRQMVAEGHTGEKLLKVSISEIKILLKMSFKC